MIKTHSGEMVELRARMILRDIDENVDFTVKDNAHVKILCEFGDAFNGLLLHTPFMVGDEFQWVKPYARDLVDMLKTWKNPAQVESNAEAAFMNERPHKYQHKNPALRDHPDYKPNHKQDD